jgi:CubicO group peptidase (beta-lactamase class C family)
MRIGFTAAYLLALTSAIPWAASAQLAPETLRSIDTIVGKAYGIARLDRAVPATPDMRYKIGSNTKQFVAAAMLLLVQDGKVSLDDKVARFLPDLTRAGDVSMRQLLSYTAGLSTTTHSTTRRRTWRRQRP